MKLHLPKRNNKILKPENSRNISAFFGFLPYPPVAAGVIFLLLLFVGCKDNPGVDFESIHPENYSPVFLDHYLNTDIMMEKVAQMSGTRAKIDSLLYWTELLKNYEEEAAIIYAAEADRLATGENWKFSRAISLYYLAMLKGRQTIWGESVENALVDAKISEQLFRTSSREDWKVKVNNLIGGLYYNKFESDTAFIYQSKALEILEVSSFSEKDKLRLRGRIYHDLANIYWDKDSLDLTLEYYHKALEIYQQPDDQAEMARLLQDLGKYYSKQRDFEKAEAAFSRALTLAHNINDTEVLADVYQDLGNVRYLQYKKEPKDSIFSEGMAYFGKSLLLGKENRFRSYDLIAKMYQKRLVTVSRDQKIVYTDSAIVYFNKAIAEVQREGAFEYMQSLVENLSKLCNWRQKIFKKDCMDVLGVSDWSLLNNNYSQIVAKTNKNLEAANFRLRNFERSRQEAVHKSRIRTNWMISLLALLAAGFVFLVLYFKQQQKRLQNRMEALRAQINPHFVANSLNAIESLVNLDKKEAAAKYLIHFSRLSRRILNSSRAPHTSVADELQTLKHFLALEQLRFRDKLQYEINIAPDLSPEQIEIPAMILQPYVENAILHGIKPKTGQGNLIVQVKKEGKYLICTVEDDGIGREKARQIKEKSVFKHQSQGMKITEERLKMVGKVKGSKVDIIDLYDDAGNARGTRVVLRIPYTELKLK